MTDRTIGLLLCLATASVAMGQDREQIIVAMGEDGPLDNFADIDRLLEPPPLPSSSLADGSPAAPSWLDAVLSNPAELLNHERVAQLIMCEECMTPGVWPAPTGVELPAADLTRGGFLGIPGAFRIARQGGPHLLPTGILFRPYLASPKESRLSSVYQFEQDDGWLWDHTLGGRFGLIRWGNCDTVFPQGVQIDVEGSAQLRQDPEVDMNLRSTDYRWGIPLAFGYGRHRTKLGYYHISSHLGDEFLVAGGGPRVNYLRDSIVLAHAVYLWPSLRVYGEADWGFNTDASRPWHFQFGTDFSPARGTSGWGAPFFAVNGRLRQEVNFGGGLTAQAGWAWRSDHNGRLLRIGAHYFNGRSSQYSFFSQHEQLIGLGVWLDN